MLNGKRILGFSGTVSFGTVYELKQGKKQLGIYLDKRIAYRGFNSTKTVTERLACFYRQGQDLATMLIDNKQIKIKDGPFVPSDIIYDATCIQVNIFNIYEVLEETPLQIERVLLTVDINEATAAMLQGSGRSIRRRIGGEYQHNGSSQYFVLDTRIDYNNPHDHPSNHQRFVKVGEVSFDSLVA